MKQKELVEMLADTYAARNRGQCPSSRFISIRGRIRQLCHKHGYRFPDVDREAKVLAKVKTAA